MTSTSHKKNRDKVAENSGGNSPYSGSPSMLIEILDNVFCPQFSYCIIFHRNLPAMDSATDNPIKGADEKSN
jgi:hypothetical protein